MKRMIDADKLLAALGEYPGSVSELAMTTVKHCIDLQMNKRRAPETWRNPGWEERRDATATAQRQDTKE